jgi:prepilin-type N-terminal cleavage/methylation domain-containing protein
MSTSRIQKGFTLLEMLVSLALFSVVMVIVAAAYLNLINLDRQTRATNDVVNNLSFAIDNMARSIRTGTTYTCIPGDLNGNGTCSQFSFYDANNCFNTYSVVSSVLVDSVTDPKGTGKCLVGTNVPLTASNVTVTAATFYVRNVGSGDGLEPYVTFIVQGSIYVDAAHPAITFAIQTSANERGIEL